MIFKYCSDFFFFINMGFQCHRTEIKLQLLQISSKTKSMKLGILVMKTLHWQIILAAGKNKKQHSSVKSSCFLLKLFKIIKKPSIIEAF